MIPGLIIAVGTGVMVFLLLSGAAWLRDRDR